MKGLFSVIATILQDRTSRTNLQALVKLLLVLLGLIVGFTVVFHLLMEREGQHHSWVTGLYWTLTVMTTLGFGDITFAGDIGRFFSIVVLVTGVIFMLVLLPFTFIEFFYAPWMRAQAASKAPRELPETMEHHVILTAYDAVASALIPMLQKYGHPYVVLCPTLAEALELGERGIKSAVGDLDDPETYRKMRIEKAAMLVTTRSDMINVNVTFTARELVPHMPIVASAASNASRDVLELAGVTLALRLEEVMGNTLARRISIRDSDAHVIGNIYGLMIAEASAAGTSLVGSTLSQSRIRALTGASIIGTWNHGCLEIAEPDKLITAQTLFVVAGTKEQLARFNATFTTHSVDKPRVLIIGGGRVGRATYHALREMDVCSISLIEKMPERVKTIPDAVIGDALEMDVLKQAFAREATTLIITTHDDDTNVALTIFFRRLRSNWQILTRSTMDRNVPTLLRAGADLVLSYAAMGANTILNILRGSDHLLLAEGVNVFPAEIPPSMAGKKISELQVRSQTGCTIIAVEDDGQRVINPPADYQLPLSGRIFLIGNIEAEDQFLTRFKPVLQVRKKGSHI
ncbi:Trk K+ transport system NAD-binding subunit [Prosthecobacter fusiformis]|uniref:Trk K+ transport system NAD-binding subunit n=1 Tax=Prosthecobacter fusiformis TaxID=48464 RepID=A0A4V3FG50_9BACT|nr:NAD-binding protein [Prosthecobacter fusiformis]TDU73313.1 Trk K+ transport system NAD-binding subunit [Prosthecobacter fusiformis]